MRNRIVKDNLVLEKVNSSLQISDFSCGNPDLDDYFHNDSEAYRQSLFTQTYALHFADEGSADVLALVDFCNDSLSNKLVSKKERKRIAFSKRNYQTYPAVKITRLGVDQAAQHQHIGTKLLDMIKEFFVTENRSGCRFITVDAYREAVPFYEKNGFLLAKTIEDEEDRQSSTVPLFFDLISISQILD